MADYEPGNEKRGTCPNCERRVKVRVPRNGDGSIRICCWHKLPARNQLFTNEKVCHGVGMICVEDRRP